MIDSLDACNVISSIDSLKRTINKLKHSVRNIELTMNLASSSKSIPYLFSKYQNSAAEGKLKNLDTSKIDGDTTQTVTKKSTVKTNYKIESLNYSIEEAK